MTHEFVKLTRKDLLRRVAAHTGLPMARCKAVMDATLNCLGDMFMEEGPEKAIELRNLGVFKVRRTPPRPSVRNLRTGEAFTLPARRKVFFKPSKRIKAVLNQPLDTLAREESVP